MFEEPYLASKTVKVKEEIRIFKFIMAIVEHLELHTRTEGLAYVKIGNGK